MGPFPLNMQLPYNPAIILMDIYLTEIWTHVHTKIVMNAQNNFIHNSQKLGGLPWWRSGWESACQCRGHGFEPWSGKIPHAAEQLGPWATITEPAGLEPVLRNKRGRDSERPTHRNEEEWPPLAATRESPRTEMKTQHSQKQTNKQNKKQKLETIQLSFSGWVVKPTGISTSWILLSKKKLIHNNLDESPGSYAKRKSQFPKVINYMITFIEHFWNDQRI